MEMFIWIKMDFAFITYNVLFAMKPNQTKPTLLKARILNADFKGGQTHFSLDDKRKIFF